MHHLKLYKNLAIFFAMSSALLVVFAKKLDALGINSEVVQWGNILLLAITATATFLLVRGLKAAKTTSFIQAVYGSLIVKFFISAVAIFIYVKTSATVNKPAIFVLMGLYLVYTFIEVKLLSQVTAELKKNAQTKSTL